jgi:VWFA-related protein
MKPIAIALPLALLAASLGAQQPSPPAPSPSPSPSPTGTAAGDKQASPSDLQFPAQIEQVTVDVVVTDKKGVPITDLKTGDFTVLEDGKPQNVVTFDSVSVPAQPSATPPPKPKVSINTAPQLQTGRTFVLVFDDIHLTPFQAVRAKSAVVQFLKTGVREGDRVSLVATGGGAWWSTRMEAGREELITMVGRLEGRHIPDRSPERMTDYEAMRIHTYNDQQVEARVSRRFEQYGAVPAGGMGRGGDRGFDEPDPYVRGRAADVYFQSVSRNRITLQIVDRVLKSLESVKGRKSMILVSEGFIYDPNLDDFKKVVQSSRRSNMAIYFLDTRGLEGLPFFNSAEYGPALDTQDIGAAFADNLQEAEGAESLASDSGGFTVKNSNDLSKGIQRIADESRNYYLLGYNPSNATADGRFRKIEVKVARSNTRVRARKGYYAPLPPGKQAEEKKSGPDPVIQAALDSPFEVGEVPMRMTAYIFDETLLGKASVLIATDVDVREFGFEEKEGRFQDTLEFLLVVIHRETGEFFRYDQKIDMNLLPATRQRLTSAGFPLVRDFELSPGGYQSKMVVRDKNTGRIGTIVHEFEVPDLAQLRVSTPVISDTLQPAQQGSESGVPRPAVLARRAFPSGATLYCQFEVYGAAKDPKTGMPRVSAGYVIRNKAGAVMTQVAPTEIKPTSLGKLSRLMGTGLQDAAPGEYEFVLNLRDEIAGKDLELAEPFTVQEARMTFARPE